MLRREADGKAVTVRNPRPGELWAYTQSRLRWVDSILQAQGLRRALKRGDLEALHAERAPAIVQAIEGSHFLEGRLERIEEVHARGLRHLQLVHFYTSDMGDNQTEPAEQGGLTALGRQAIEECNRLGIVVDVAHATQLGSSRPRRGVQDTAAALAHRHRPARRSHAALHAAHHLGAREVVAQTGGVVDLGRALALQVDRLVGRRRPRGEHHRRGSRRHGHRELRASAPCRPCGRLLDLSARASRCGAAASARNRSAKSRAETYGRLFDQSMRA